jgi:S-adenosylmethionine synthetase
VTRQNYFFTSESVAEGHPDKVCDRISDEIVDLVYREAKKTGMDPWKVRVACETLATTNRVVIAGEVRVPETLLKKDKAGNILKDAAGHPVINPAKFKSVARKAIREIGYEQAGFHWKTAKIEVLLHGQSPISARASTTPPTARAKKVPATRASCSAMPAAKRRT